ncbi:MAG: secondary thiamine-phosphate synthase enzyme YjbQ [Pseudomonadota bacterium]
MLVANRVLELKTEGLDDFRDITPKLWGVLKESGIRSGLLTVFCPGSTGAITTIEYESGVLKDLKDALERIAPTDHEYAHNVRWGDGNGVSHVRAALMKPSLTIPVVDGRLCLGTWQQVVFLDFDNRPRTRRVMIQVLGTDDREETSTEEYQSESPLL